jgi:hypothetical protein
MPPTFSFWKQIVNILQVRVVTVIPDIMWQLLFSEKEIRNLLF